MAERNAAVTPYNFVPFSDKILVRYTEISKLPGHDTFNPDLKTGEIRVTFTADTPVFVSDGKESDPDFYRGANGKYMIPGSTIRGMLRENMQILGFGLVRRDADMDDFELFFRKMADGRGSTGGELKTFYQDKLDVKTGKTDAGKPISTPHKVQAGYLRKRGSGYVIQPVEGGYIRVSRGDPLVQQFGERNACAIAVGYEAHGSRLTQLSTAADAPEELQRGMLLYTGKPVGKKANSLYLFPPADESAQTVEIPKKDEISYAEDWEGRKNALKGGNGSADFWKLPEAGTEKPVFYAEIDGHVYFGMTLFLRIGYGHTLAEGLPQNHIDKAKSEGPVLDYVHAIFGYAEGDQTYKSRVSVSDFPLMGNEKPGKQIPVILGEPKPSYFPGYVKNGQYYSDPDFQLRGYKQYWLKDPVSLPAPEKDKVATKLRPLPKGARFEGVIRFKNLTEDELGLLLWTLKLDEGCFQSIGQGKPYGYGRMKVEITDLLEYDPAALYGGDAFTVKPISMKNKIEACIQAYDDYAAKALYLKKPKKRPSVRSRDEIMDFLYMKSAIRKWEDTRYMTLEEYTNANKANSILETVQKVREAGENREVKPAEKKTETTDDWAAMFNSKFKKL